MKRVLITGIGIASPLGVGHEALWSRLLEADTPEQRAPQPRAGVPAPECAYAFTDGFDAEQYANRRTLRKVSDLTRLVTVAAHLCLEDAAPEDASPGDAAPGDAASGDARDLDLDREQTGIYFGTCFGSSGYHLEYHEALRRGGLKAASALLFTQSVFNAPAGHLAQVHGCHGASLTLVGGETVGLDAIAAAADRIRLGADRSALAGGAEEYNDLVHASIHQLGVVGDQPAGAFGEAPGPFVEGAALLLLEEGGSARRVLAEVLGSGAARGDDSPARAVRQAGQQAALQGNVSLRDVDLVVCSAAGGATARREMESLAGQFSHEPFLTAPKGWSGEGFAFTSALQAVVATLALARGVVPPTVTGAQATPPPAGFRLVAEPRCVPLRCVLVVASTSQGGATAMILGAARGNG